MKTPLQVGIIGCGNISNQYFTGLKAFDVVNVAGAADLDFARAEAKGKEHGVRPYTVEKLLDDSSIDIVINLTVPQAHAPVNLAILGAGKHAYTEKPFALGVAEGQKVIDFAAQTKLRVGCAPDTFLGGGIQTARKAIDDGLIGEPIGAVGNMASRGPEGWHPNPDFLYQPGGGPMLDMGPYYLTALVNLLGPIRRVTGSSRISFPERTIGSGERKGKKIRVEVPTHYAGVFDFASGPVAALNISFDIWHHNLPIIEIYGTEGSLRVPDPNTFGGVVELRRFDEEWHSVPLTHSDKVGRGIGVADLAAAVQGNRPHRASGQLALHVLEAMLAVQLASESEAHVHLQTTVAKPAPLPPGLPFGQLDA
jgi:predicted dehydrogenase